MNVVDTALAALSCVPCPPKAAATRIVEFLADAQLLKGALVMALLWGLWLLGDRARTAEIRGRVIMTVAGAFAALCVARLLALLLPFRDRPFEAITAVRPEALRALEDWSAFPSDHAAMFFALATGIFMVSRSLGALALAHAVVVISLPRLYLGLHHPTDLLAGAVVGVACALAASWAPVRARCAAPILAWAAARPPWFAAVAFVMTFEIATLFDSVRNGAKVAWKVAGPIVRAAPPRIEEVAAVVALAGLLLAAVRLVCAYRLATAARQMSSSAR